MKVEKQSSINCVGERFQTIVPVDVARLMELEDKSAIRWVVREVRSAIPGMSMVKMIITVEKVEE